MTTDLRFPIRPAASIPALGFGTWQIPDGKVAYDSVASALQCGYRHIDTAYAYGNERSVGRAVRDSGIAREEIFVTSKLPAEVKSYAGALRRWEETMANLDLGYVDLYLIHAPWPWSDIGADYRRENVQVWKAMEEIYEGGQCRAVGVSNFNVADLENILAGCRIVPMANQIKVHVGHAQAEIVAFCRSHEILVEGYSPFKTGAILGHRSIADLAQKYGRTVAQICVRYLLQKEIVALPKSTHAEYIRQNGEVDFAISAEDMALLDGMRTR